MSKPRKRTAGIISITQLFSEIPVTSARERSSRVEVQRVDNANTRSATDFVTVNTEEGPTVRTDDSRIQQSLPFNYDSVFCSSGGYAGGNVYTNGIESVSVFLKRFVHNTWRRVFQKHFRQHLNKVAMCLNLGNRRVDSIDRIGAFIRGIAGKRTAYRGPVG